MNRFSSLAYNDDDDDDPTPTPLTADFGCTLHLADNTTPLMDEVATPNGTQITTASSDKISFISDGQLPFNLPKKVSIYHWTPLFSIG